MRTVVLLSLISSAVFMALPRQRAEACSPPPDFQLNEAIGAEGLTEVPLNVVAIFASVSDSGFIVVEVADEEGRAIPGTFEVMGNHWGGSWGSVTNGRLLWRPTEPLQPGARYTMTVTGTYHDWNGPSVIPFTTRASQAQSEPVFAITETTLFEDIYVSDQVCCEDWIDSCGIDNGGDCWATESSTSHNLYARLSYAADAGRYAEIEVALDDGSSRRVLSGLDTAYVGTRIDDLQAAHCLVITMRSLIDGRTTNQATCARADQMLLDTPPELYADDVCDGREPGDPAPVPEPSGGCSASTGTAPSASLLLLLGVALLITRRRRA